jgi:hypothetical protein
MKKSYSIILAVFIILLGGLIFYQVKKESFFENKLEKALNKKTDRLYEVSFDSTSIDEVGGNIFIKNIIIKGDTSRLLQAIKAGDTSAANMVLSIVIPSLKVEGFKTAKALLAKKMECEQIIITDPVVNLYLFPGHKKKENKKQQEELYKQILGDLNLVKAERVLVRNASVTAQDFYTKEKKFTTYNTTINLLNVAIDSTYSYDTSKTFFCDEISLASEKLVLGDKQNTAEITGVTFDTKSKVVTLVKAEYDAYKNKGFFKGSAEGLTLEGLEFIGPVENTDLIINKAEISKIELDVLAGNSNKEKNKSKTGSYILTGLINKFSINSLALRSLDFISRSQDNTSKPFIIRNNAFYAKNININRRSKLDKSLISEAKEVEVSNDQIKILSNDKRYEFRMSGLRANTKGSIRMSRLQVIPQLSEAAFAKNAIYQVDRFDVDIKDFLIDDVDVGRMMEGEVVAGKITSNSNTIKVFRDMSYPIDSVTKRSAKESFPHQLIQNLNLNLRINSFIAKNLLLEYKEKNPLSNKSGTVVFANSTLAIRNISNQPAKEGDKMIADFSTSFLSKIPLSGRFTFFLHNWKKGRFAVEANVNEPFDAKLLTQLTEPLSMIRIDKGIINRVKFNTNADTAISKGHFEMIYDDMKVSLLKKKGEGFAKKSALSVFANVLVKNKNEEGDKMRIAEVSVDRNKYKSFFNFIWMTIFLSMKRVMTVNI